MNRTNRGRRMPAILSLAFALSCLNTSAASLLPESALPGQLVFGRTEIGSTVFAGARKLRVDPRGRFVFGIAADAAGSAIVEIRLPNGEPERHAIQVLPREYAIERVNGLPQQTVTPDPLTEKRIADEQARVAAVRTRDDDRDAVFGEFGWPATGRISGVFGSQRILNGVPKNPHFGIDIAAPQGTPIRAPQDGMITFAESDLVLTGGTVLIDHGHGVSSVFIHMSRLDVAVGQPVAKGEIIGAVGATGRASGPHLHWGMNWFDLRIDPSLITPTRTP